MHMLKDSARRLARAQMESENRSQVVYEIPGGWETCSLEYAKAHGIIFDELLSEADSDEDEACENCKHNTYCPVHVSGSRAFLGEELPCRRGAMKLTTRIVGVARDVVRLATMIALVWLAVGC